MDITAKVRCATRVRLQPDLDAVTFYPDYTDLANAAWAASTPALSLAMNVRPDVKFEPGTSYTLTFTPAAPAPTESTRSGFVTEGGAPRAGSTER